MTCQALGTDRSSEADLRIGTSGWHYADWWGPFYPDTVRKKDALIHYATRFNTTELNAPFYRTPTENAVRNWAESTTREFRFAWKAPRFITHFKRLQVDDASLQLLEDRVRLLGEKAGPLLFQLPPQMPVDRDRLAVFLKRLGTERRHCFEFRHASWYCKDIFELLGDHAAALCLSDHASAPAPREVTADWIYIRNHGPGGRYHGSYSDTDLDGWAQSIDGWLREGRDVWCFFDNDVKSAAPGDAQRLLSRLGRVAAAA
jgi:uncharacterized protein YecE (DUF72 family)